MKEGSEPRSQGDSTLQGAQILRQEAIATENRVRNVGPIGERRFEDVAPDGHFPRAGRLAPGTRVDDGHDADHVEAAPRAPGQLRQIGHGLLQLGRERAACPGIGAVAARAIVEVQISPHRRGDPAASATQRQQRDRAEGRDCRIAGGRRQLHDPLRLRRSASQVKSRSLAAIPKTENWR